jgi:PAS domain S-box-containing protein
MKSNAKSTTPIIAAHAKKNNGKQPAPPSEGKSNGAKRVSRVSSKMLHKLKCQALDRISDGIIAFDAQMNPIYVNERAGKILGREPQDLIGENFLTIYPDLIGKPIVEACQRALETQTVIPFDGYFSPSSTWFEARAYPSDDGVSVLLREGRLLEESPRLASYNIFDVSQFPEQNPNPVMRFRRNGELLYANPASASLLASWKRQTPHNLPIELQELLFAVSETGSNKEIELENNGKIYNCLMVPVPESEYVNLYFSDITKRTRAEEAVRESEEKYRRIVETANEGIWEIDKDTRTIFVNRSMAKMLGYTPEEMMGRSSFEFVVPEDYSEGEHRLERAKQGVPSRAAELRYQRKDGSTIWAIASSTPRFDEQGNFIGSMAMITDVTERKQAEENIQRLNGELQSQLEETQALLDILPTGVWIGNEDCSVITGNSSAYKIMGLPSGINASVTTDDPQMPAGLRIFVNGEEVAPEDAPMQVVARSRKPLYNVEHEILFQNGIRKSVVANIVPVFDNQGNVRKVIGAYTDFTERKQTEQTLARERILLERLFDTMPVMVSMYDAEIRSMHVNREFERILGWKGEDLSVAALLEALYPDPEYRSDVLQRMALAAETKDWVEVNVQARDGRTRNSLWANISIMNGQQLVTGIALGIDITERKRQEQQLVEKAHLLDLTNDAMIVRDSQDRVTYWNRGAEQLYGWRSEEVLGKVSHELLQTQHPKPVNEIVADLLRAGSWSGELAHTRRDGTRIITFSRWTIERDAQGQRTFILETNTDITERKEGERVLVEYARQQSALYKLVDQLHRADILTDIFDASLDAIVSALQCDRASILLFDETKVMHFVAWHGLSEDYRKATDGHSPWKYGEENPTPIWYDDVNSSDLSDSLKAVIAREGIGSLAFIPLVYQETLIGKFMMYYNTPHVFTESEINLSLTIGRQLASGVDRKHAEERLRSSEDRLRLAISAGKIGIWDIDLIRRDRAWSKEGKAVYGLADDEYLDFERQLELTHPDDREYVEQSVRAFRDEGRTKQLNLEHRIVHPDGSIHWVEVQGEAVYGEGRLPIRLIGTIVDITERKLIEDALRQSEERFAQFMKYLPGLAWIKDINGRYVFANAAAENAFGVERDELYSKTDVEVFPAEVAAQFMKNDDLALTAAKGIQVVETLEQDDGVVHYSLVTKFPIPGVDGKPALIGGTAFDITEQRQMENALRDSEERYRALVNQATAGIVRKDSNGKLIFVNDAFCEMLGYSAAELQEKTMWQITHPEDVGENRRLYNRLMTEGVPFALEKRLVRRDGSIIWVTVSVSPVLDEHGKPESAVSVYADITDRKRAESRLTLLTKVSDLARRLEDPVELMASVADVVGSHFQARRCLFNEIEPEHDREIVHRDYHDGVESVAGIHKLTDYSNITTSEMIAGKTVVNYDSKIDPRTASDYERSYVPNGERAYVAIPLTREDRWVASLWISDDKPRQWSEEDVALLQTIAERTWTATEKLRINNALRDSEERLRKLNAELEERVQRRTAELQAAYEFLRESEATSRLILESMPDAILIADRDGNIVYGNTQVEHLFGYATEEVIGQPVEVLIPQRFHSKHVDHRSDYGQNPHRSYMGLDRELFGQRKNQSEFPVDVMLSPISNNTNWDVLVTIRDNTEQKQAQQALRANEEKLRKLFQVLPVGISFLNHQGQISEMNSALTDILGLSKHELLEGRYRQRRYIRSDGSAMPPSEFASVRALEEKKTIHNVETGIVKEDGSTIWTSVHAAPVDVADVDVVVATIDITERKKAEETLHKHRERLRILSRRLVEVQEEERRSLARELHDRVGQNLAALNLNLNILRSQLTNTALLEVGQRLSDSVNLVNQILSITRNVMGDLRSDVLDDYGLEAAVREYAEKFTARTGVQVVFDKSAKTVARMEPSIEMTLLRIAQEALTNVAKHAQAKQATVSFSADHEAVYMSIQDDGIGILSWQRANQPGSHGLRIIRERAEAFGGSVQVQSTYKKGTRIDVKIPLANVSQSRVPREKRS